MHNLTRLAAVTALACLWFGQAAAKGKYDEGASDTEIRIGQTVPYSGPASHAGVVGRIQTAYFRMVNEKGGINGRKVNLISLDDHYSPPKTVEATRKLVEQEGVLATFYSVGTAAQNAVQRYLAAKKVPQLMVGSGAAKWNNPKDYPWSTPSLALYSTEGRVFAKWLLKNKPDAKVAILMQNDDVGRDFVSAFKEALGDKAKTMVVAEASYDFTDPTVDSQMVKLASSGANVFFNISIGKYASQSMKKVGEINWDPLHYIISPSANAMLMKAAGEGGLKGAVSLQSNKRAGSPRWANDPDLQAYEAFRAKYTPTVNPGDDAGFYAYAGAALLAELLRDCGDNLTRENLMKLATNLNGRRTAYMLPGLTLSTTPDNYEPITTFYMATYDGKDWQVPEKPFQD